VTGDRDILVMNADGTGVVDVSNDEGTDFAPAWSPDGDSLAFRNDRTGNFEIFVMNADGSDQTNLTNDPGLDRQPAWSPDGSALAFGTDRTGNYEVFSMASDGSNQKNLTNHPAVDNQPDWGTGPLPPTGLLGSQTALSSNAAASTTSIAMVDVPGLTGLSVCAFDEISVTVSVQLTGKSVGFQVQMDDEAILQPGSIRFIPAGHKAAFSFTFIDRARMDSGTDMHVLDMQWNSPLGRKVTLLRGTLSVQYQDGVCP
jgi:hypothetical protein